MDDFERLLERINQRGWLVSACYQTGMTKWIVCLRKNGSHMIAYGNGLTASMALLAAYRMMPREREKLRR